MKCGENIVGHVPEDVLCSHCRGANYFFDFARSVTSAQGPVNEIMHAYKYGRQIHLHRELALLMEELWKDPRLAVQKNRPGSLFPYPCTGKGKGGDGLINRTKSQKRWLGNATSAAKER
ncbi:MAG: hypothetical protein CMN02_04270 [Roseibacillus sp.]|nr:hypothetical protein [Roseibacillus sp.]